MHPWISLFDPFSLTWALSRSRRGDEISPSWFGSFPMFLHVLGSCFYDVECLCRRDSHFSVYWGSFLSPSWFGSFSPFSHALIFSMSCLVNGKEWSTVLGFEVVVFPMWERWNISSCFLHFPHFLQAGKSVWLSLCEWIEEIHDLWAWRGHFFSHGAMDVFPEALCLN